MPFKTFNKIPNLSGSSTIKTAEYNHIRRKLEHCIKRGAIMRVHSYNLENNSEINSKETLLHFSQEKTGYRSKFNTSMEKKIERVWFQSKTLGWSYNDFVVHLLEVLVTLQHKQKVKQMTAPKQGIAAKIAP